MRYSWFRSKICLGCVLRPLVAVEGRSDISRENARSPGISASPPPSFGQKILQQFHLHPQLNQFVVLLLCFVEQTFVRSALRLRSIAVGDQPLLAVLTFDQFFNLLFAQSEMGTDLPVRFSCGLSPEHLFAERLYLCILSGRDSTSCCSFYSTTGGAFFHCSFLGVWSSPLRVALISLFCQALLRAFS